MNDQESPVIAEIAEGFEGTTVEVTQIPFDGAQAAYDQQAAGGEAPDVFRAEIAWIADYADKQYLLPLTGLYERLGRLPRRPARLRAVAG